MTYIVSTITIILAMSFSIKTILKLICLLGLFACTSKPASAQSLEVSFDDIADRISNTEQRKISRKSDSHIFTRPNLTFSWDGMGYNLSINGIAANDITNMYLVSPSGQQYSLQSLMIATNLYQLSSLQTGYYTIVVQYVSGTLTKNIHLQH